MKERKARWTKERKLSVLTLPIYEHLAEKYPNGLIAENHIENQRKKAKGEMK